MIETAMTKELKRLNQMFSEIGVVYHEAAWKLGLSDSAMSILYSICNLGDGCLLSDVVFYSGISKQTINSALRKMEQEGVLRLEASKGRKKQICLTEKGRQLTEDTVSHIIKMENEILEGWTKEERENYFRLTEKYLEDVKRSVGKMEERKG